MVYNQQKIGGSQRKIATSAIKSGGSHLAEGRPTFKERQCTPPPPPRSLKVEGGGGS